jgi:hypothetical protein
MGEWMRHWCGIFVAAAAAVWPVMAAEPAVAQAPALPANPQIQVDYVQPKYNSAAADKNQYTEFTAIYEWLRVRRPLDEIQKFLAPLRLPRQIKSRSTDAARRPAHTFRAPPSRSAMS